MRGSVPLVDQVLGTGNKIIEHILLHLKTLELRSIRYYRCAFGAMRIHTFQYLV
jgi:hypothetical protein